MNKRNPNNNKKTIDERIQINFNEKKKLEYELMDITHFGCLSTKMINWYINNDIQYYWRIYNRQQQSMRHFKYANGDKTSLVFQNGSHHLSLDQRDEILKTFEGLFGNVCSKINFNEYVDLVLTPELLSRIISLKLQIPNEVANQFIRSNQYEIENLFRQHKESQNTSNFEKFVHNNENEFRNESKSYLLSSDSFLIIIFINIILVLTVALLQKDLNKIGYLN